MPRYFFDITAGNETADREGELLADADAVERAALRVLMQIAEHEAIANDQRSFSVRVRDEAGKVVYLGTLKLDAGWIAD